tara:strand:- start:367 stop:618 length:252 start_codon:yes stop_codon:yes gene_type:complete
LIYSIIINRYARYISEDIGSGTPLVLVHGFLRSLDMWSSQTKFFKNNFRVIVQALLSFGNSSAINSCDSIECMAKAVLQLLKK